MIQLNSFGCGLDAVTTDCVSDILTKSGKIYTVFAVQKDKFECTEFLIYDDTWGWVWRSPLDYVPVEVENE